MFARYAHAPNALGYCGPPLGATLRDGAVDEVRKAATQFSGAWPYLRVLAKMTGIADPLDYRLVESYWLGGGVGANLDPGEFFDALLAIIGPQAGQYWSHLTPDLAGEAAGNHCFHVFGVYPWTRFLGRGMDEQPLSVLDNCRINWGTVLSRDGDDVEGSCCRLEWGGHALGLSEPWARVLGGWAGGDGGEVAGCLLGWDGQALSLSEPSARVLDVWADGYSAMPEVTAGDEVAI